MYKHTQIGWGTIFLLGAAIAIYLYFYRQKADLALLAILIITLILFSSLTVTVDENLVKLRFGPVGFPGKTFKIIEVDSCRPVKNLWFRINLGIHYSLKAGLYNVSGMKTVELKMKNGKLRYIGTDEPEILCKTIENQILRQKYISRKRFL